MGKPYLTKPIGVQICPRKEKFVDFDEAMTKIKQKEPDSSGSRGTSSSWGSTQYGIVKVCCATKKCAG